MGQSSHATFLEAVGFGQNKYHREMVDPCDQQGRTSGASAGREYHEPSLKVSGERARDVVPPETPRRGFRFPARSLLLPCSDSSQEPIVLR